MSEILAAHCTCACSLLCMLGNFFMFYLVLVARKSVFRVSDKVRFKPACSGTGSSYKIEILLVATLDIILFNKRKTKALISLPRWAGWSAPLLLANPENRFSCIKAHLYQLIFFQINVFKKFFQDYHQSVEQFGSRPSLKY